MTQLTKLNRVNRNESPAEADGKTSTFDKHLDQAKKIPVAKGKKDAAPFPTIYSEFPGDVDAFIELSKKEQNSHYSTYLRKADAAGQLAKPLFFTCSIHGPDGVFSNHNFVMAKTRSGILVQLKKDYFATPPVLSGLYLSPTQTLYNQVDARQLTQFDENNLNQILDIATNEVSARSYR
jgi:hypothetical protein